MEMDRDNTTVRLERRVRKLVRVNRLLVLQRDKALRDIVRASIEVDNVRDLLSDRGLCDHCRRALRDAARVELAA